MRGASPFLMVQRIILDDEDVMLDFACVCVCVCADLQDSSPGILQWVLLSFWRLLDREMTAEVAHGLGLLPTLPEAPLMKIAPGPVGGGTSVIVDTQGLFVCFFICLCACDTCNMTSQVALQIT